MSSTTDRELRHDVFRQVWRRVVKYQRDTARLLVRHFSTQDLAGFGITMSQLDWHADDIIDFEPRFCTPYPADSFEPLFRRTKATNYPARVAFNAVPWDSDADEDKERRERGYEPETRSERSLRQARQASWWLDRLMGTPSSPLYLAAKGDWLSCPRGGPWRLRCTDNDRHSPSPSDWIVANFRRAMPWPQYRLPKDPKKLEKLRRKIEVQSKGEWTTVIDDWVRRPGRKSLVHMGVIIHDDSDISETRILRSELFAALGVMIAQMTELRNRRTHAIFPVFVYSWSGYHVRIVQVHFDLVAWKLIVRKTSYIEISSPDHEREIKLMLRWMMSTPIGTTSWEELDLRKFSPLVDTTSSGSPPPSSQRPIPCI